MEFPYARIVALAVRDEEFKAAMLKAPKEALGSRLDVTLPRDVDVEVVVDSKQLVHVVVPRTPGLRGEERGLVREFLERVRADEEYRERLRREPRRVIGEFLGFTLPEVPRLEVVIETEKKRVVQLPAVGAEGIATLSDAEAFWGGGEDWEVKGTQFESGQACSCFTEESEDWGSSIPNCCIPETDGPEGASGGGPRGG